LNPLTACKPGYVGIDLDGSNSRIAYDGEIELSGAGVFAEYLNKPDETKESFTTDGWFKTGDLVVKDENGYIKIVDRKKAILCTASGKKVAPAKLENLFSTSSAVDQVFLIGDERNFISALIVPNFNYFIEKYTENNIPFIESESEFSEATGAKICMKTNRSFINQPMLKQMIEMDVDRVNESLERY
jgi:long-chain acyl-CoA synthetase